jgi:hypothetical protein
MLRKADILVLKRRSSTERTATGGEPWPQPTMARRMVACHNRSFDGIPKKRLKKRDCR